MPEHDLILLTWRYAALIGIVPPEAAEMTQAQVDADRAMQFSDRGLDNRARMS